MGRDDLHPSDSVPWLEAVDDEEPRGISGAKMLAALALVLLGVGVVAATLFYLGREQGGSGPPELIRAPEGPYKIRPADPGGLDISGESGTAYATGAGEEQESQLDLERLDDLPPPPDEEADEQVFRKPPNETKEPVRDEPPATPVPPAKPGSTIQLGAYGSTAKAETAWKMLSARFPEVAAMSKQLEPYSGGIRLRATASSPEQARAACRAVSAGGENCFVVR